MKVAVFSDTHGSYRGMADAVRSYAPDQVIHLGDGYNDAMRLAQEFPQIPVCAVPGNCDYDCEEPDHKVIELSGLKLFLTHGHRYGVRYGKLDTLLYAAQCSDAQLALFGHTHRAGFEETGGIFVLNPGTAGRGTDKTWAALELGKHGEINCVFNTL